MNLIKYYLLIFISIVMLAGCATTVITEPKVGMQFDSDLWAKGSNNAYVQVINTANGVLYRNNRAYSPVYKSGIIVSDGKIIRVLSPVETDKLITDQQRADAELQKMQKLRAEQINKQQQINADIAEQKRISELKSRKYSIFPAKVSVKSQSSGWGKAVITSIDDDPFLLERVVINNRVGVKNCDNGGYLEYMTTGDSRSIQVGNCGESIVRVDVYTNRGTLNLGVK